MSWLSVGLLFLWAGVLVGFISLYSLAAIWFERKVSAHIQDRLGPMETGWHGWLQTIADMIKLLMKEDLIPTEADRPLFKLAPFVVMAAAVAAWAVLPFGLHLIGTDLNIGLYFVVAVSSIAVSGILMAGWASNNKWALYGAMRAASQMISYEIPVALSLMVPILLVQSLSMQELVAVQAGGFWHWTVFSHPPFALISFVVYFWASLAEVNRTPFDLPEGESEIVAGYHVEYSGLRWGMFYLAEYANMFLVSAVAVTAFLGGWYAPFPFMEASADAHPLLGNLLAAFWFSSKSFLLVLVHMWLRWTLPRLRVDQLMHVCWKLFLPFSFVNVLIVSLWIAIRGV